MDNFRIYPRGFIGINSPIQTLSTKAAFSNITNTKQYDTNIGNSDTRVIPPNLSVEKLYNALIRDTILIDSPEFRIRALRVAIEAFGISSFLYWFTLQYKNNVSGSLHNDFLLDTLKFIKIGSRSMSVENWSALITITDETDTIGHPGDKVKDFFGVNKDSPLELARENINLTEVLQKWCSQPNGLLDLINTLHILFGNP